MRISDWSSDVCSSDLSGALSRRAINAGELLRQVGSDAIDGARGNSGAILAQFLQGMSEAVGALPVLDTASLTRAVRRGAVAARAALSEPRDGTILSVIHAYLGRPSFRERVCQYFSFSVFAFSFITTIFIF